MREAAVLFADARGDATSPWFVLVLLPTLYVASSLLLARFGDWKKWSAQFACSAEPQEGVTCSARSVRLLGHPQWSYQGSLFVRLTPEGIFLRPRMSFGLFHPSLLLPWGGVREVRERRFLGVRWLEVLCRSDAPPLQFRLPWSARPILALHGAKV